MRLLRILAPVVCITAVVAMRPAPFAVLGGVAERLAHQRSGGIHVLCRLYWDKTDKFTRVVSQSRARRTPAGAVEADAIISNISVTYTGFTGANGMAAQAAFQAAVDLWMTQVASSVPMVVDANFTNLGDCSGPCFLGTAGSDAAPANVAEAPQPNTLFLLPLLNRISGTDVGAKYFGAGASNIHANFNNSANWYFGTDGIVPSGQVDFMSVVLHELGHGLGFLGVPAYTAGNGEGGLGEPQNGNYYIYERFAMDAPNGGNLLTNTAAYPNPSTSLGAALRSNNLFWEGTNARAANGNARPKLYAPNPFSEGSSFSHLDESTYGPGNVNSLMTPRIGSAEAIHTPGPIMLGMFADMGWGSNTGGSCSFGLDATGATVADGALTGTTGTSQALRVTVSAAGGCAWTATSNAGFLTVSSGASGTGSGVVRIDVAANSGGPRSGTVTIAGISYTVTQSVIGPAMAIDRSSLIFSAVTNGAAFTAKTGTQAVRLTQSGSGTVTWTATSNAPWLLVANGSGPAMSQTSGSGSATLSISVQFAPALTSPQTGTITLGFSGAGNSAGPITVTLNTFTASLAAAPIGEFESPTSGITGVAGSIAVTGWALDDVGTTEVRITRDPVAGEGTAEVFIGNAIFIDGARPDVQAAFPDYPLGSRAGWGYLLLTNFLPGPGTGTFTLKAYADDADGHTTLLGSKVITCDNANSIAPFGAIDTPRQGETITGTIMNAGWVLSPGTRRADVPGGGTVNVFVDGIDKGTPGGWGARSDITTLFPRAQYDGSEVAVAGLPLDSTTLTNGVHTIHWIVTATSGGTSGIGSRFFNVSNGSNVTLDPSPATSSSPAIAARPLLDMPRAAALRMRNAAALTSEVDAAPADPRAIRGRRGLDLDASLADYAAADGRIIVQGEELDRFELHLADGGQHHYTGYLRTVEGVRPLPVGSALDPVTGLFTWGAGPGFVGNYDLSFVRWSGSRVVARQDVRLVLNPKGSQRLGPQVIIDVPASRGDAVVERDFFLGGWAADLDSQVDRGVDTVHVWAYPVDDRGAYEQPIFIGPAVFGGARPDVAAVYGARFGESGYGIIVKGLSPGTYDIAVFAYSTARGDFAPAKTVRVTVR